MRNLSVLFVLAGILAVAPAERTAAAGLLDSLFGGSHQDCEEPECIERVPETECVKGKKLVYDGKIKYEYVSIPEVRYRWKKQWVTKEIPCQYCKPVCESSDGEQCYQTEHWDKQSGDCCRELHCKTTETKTEKTQCKHFGSETGDTVIKVRYKTCVKVPYTVYRQVKRPICVKQPRYEKVEVSVTKHECESFECESFECERCEGAGCDSCSQ